MADPILFYFDFSSPYGYLAAQQIDVIGAKHGREVTWKPMLLGAVFKVTGQQPLASIPLKGDYMLHDLQRSARRLDVSFRLPDPFPFASVAACRAFYHLTQSDPAAAKRLAKALYHAAFSEGRDVSARPAVLEIAVAQGFDASDLDAALQDDEVKDLLRLEVDDAIAAGVFGSPYIIVDGEAFWGHDRLPQVEEWLARGGW